MMKKLQTRDLNLEFHPLTPQRWSDFETLFGERGACGGCWCMLWRLTRKEFERQKGEANRRAMQAIVESGEKPGLLAYSGKQAVAWCSVAPRILKAVIQYVEAQGGKIVEGYPVEPKKGKTADVFAWTGLASFFQKAGFVECARRSETRPIMRFLI